MDKRLLEALVGERYKNLFFNNASFHTNLTWFSELLPIMVDAMAMDAEMTDRAIKARIKALEEERFGENVSQDTES